VKIHPFQERLLELFRRLEAAGPGAKVRLVHGRKHSYLVVDTAPRKEKP